MDRPGDRQSLPARISQWSMRCIDGFIPPSMRQADSEYLQHARIVTAFLFSLVVLTQCYIPFYLWVGTRTCAIVLACGSYGGAALLVLMRCTGRVHLVGNLTLAMYLLTVAVQSCFQGGAIGPKYLWFLPLPLLAVFLVHRRWAIFWITATLLTMCMFFTLHLAGYRFRNEVLQIQQTIYSSHLIGLSIGICLIGAFHEMLRNRILIRLRQAKDAAEAGARAKSEFLTNMSHEIRTPMTSILGFAENLQDSRSQPVENQEALRSILRNGRQLLAVLNDILVLSDIENDRLKVEMSQCRLADLLLEVHQFMRPAAEAQKLAFTVSLESSIPEIIQTDPARLRQILINLIGNAVKFTRSGEIRLVVRQRPADDQARRLLFDVIDTGIGISPEQMNHLFRPFEQVDASTTREFGGTGLGLVISRELAIKLGGDITVDSTPGKGSTFRVSILAPWAEGEVADLNPAPKPVVAAVPQASLRNTRILIAEDGPDNQKLITFILRKAGAEFVLAQNGREAVDAVLEAAGSGTPFDVVLMDMQMPILDGYEATHKIREAGLILPIIALTAHTMQGEREKCLAAGCNEYVTKPIQRDELIQVIQKHLPQRVHVLANA